MFLYRNLSSCTAAVKLEPQSKSHSLGSTVFGNHSKSYIIALGSTLGNYLTSLRCLKSYIDPWLRADHRNFALIMYVQFSVMYFDILLSTVQNSD